MAIEIRDQVIIVAFLAERLGLEESWGTTSNDLLFGQTPLEAIANGGGDKLIEWLCDRLGLRTYGEKDEET